MKFRQIEDCVVSVPTPMEIFRPQQQHQQGLSREPSMQQQPPAPPHSVMFGIILPHFGPLKKVKNYFEVLYIAR